MGTRYLPKRYRTASMEEFERGLGRAVPARRAARQESWTESTEERVDRTRPNPRGTRTRNPPPPPASSSSSTSNQPHHQQIAIDEMIRRRTREWWQRLTAVDTKHEERWNQLLVALKDQKKEIRRLQQQIRESSENQSTRLLELLQPTLIELKDFTRGFWGQVRHPPGLFAVVWKYMTVDEILDPLSAEDLTNESGTNGGGEQSSYERVALKCNQWVSMTYPLVRMQLPPELRSSALPTDTGMFARLYTVDPKTIQARSWWIPIMRDGDGYAFVHQFGLLPPPFGETPPVAKIAPVAPVQPSPLPPSSTSTTVKPVPHTVHPPAPVATVQTPPSLPTGAPSKMMIQSDGTWTQEGLHALLRTATNKSVG